MAVREIQKNMSEFYKYNKDNQMKMAVEEPVHFDIIFLDLNMPIMNGYEACKKIL